LASAPDKFALKVEAGHRRQDGIDDDAARGRGVESLQALFRAAEQGYFVTVRAQEASKCIKDDLFIIDNVYYGSA